MVERDKNFVRIIKNISHTNHAMLVISFDSVFSLAFCRRVVKEILVLNNRQDLATKLDHGSYVDIFEIEGKNSIKVADIMPIIEKSAETGIESDFKFYIIKNAEKLTIEAQNKLLKTLEEPNKNQFYFLCVPSRFLILPTIASRCSTIELEPNNKKEIETFLAQNGADPIKAKEDAELSLGSIEKATADQTKSDSFVVALGALTQIFGSADTAEHAAKIQKSNIEQVVEYLEQLLLDAIKLKFDCQDIWFESYKEKLIKLKTCSASGLLFIYKQIQKIKSNAKVNVSPVILADKIALAIAEGKNKK